MKTITKVLGLDKTENKAVLIVLSITTVIAIICKLTGLAN